MTKFANDSTLTIRANDCGATPKIATITKGFGGVSYHETVAAWSHSRGWGRTGSESSGFNAPLTAEELAALDTAEEADRIAAAMFGSPMSGRLVDDCAADALAEECEDNACAGCVWCDSQHAR